LDKSGGITLDDCEFWSQRLGDLIEAADIIQQRYVLEVSSPGVNRPLKKLEDFQRFSGERVSAKLFAPINGQKNFHGTLLNADEQNIYIRLEDQKRDVALPRIQVAKCKLDPLFEI
jgi:ribosome maturation factor RimP